MTKNHLPFDGGKICLTYILHSHYNSSVPASAFFITIADYRCHELCKLGDRLIGQGHGSLGYGLPYAVCSHYLQVVYI